MEQPPQGTAKILLWRGKGVVSALIRWQTRSPYSHAAVMVGDRVWEAREFRKVRRTSLYRVCAEADKKGEKIEGRDVFIGEEGAAEMMRWLDEQLGKKYDWSSVFRFVTRRQARRKAAEVWFCSEIVFAGFQHIEVKLLRYIAPWAVAPGHLAISTVPGDIHPIN